MKRKPLVPKGVDPVDLADKIKKGITNSWIARRLKLKSLLAKQS